MTMSADTNVTADNLAMVSMSFVVNTKECPSVIKAALQAAESSYQNALDVEANR
jgi:hypothetical protein